MGGVLAVLEQRDGAIKRVSHEVLAAASSVANAVGGDVHALVIGPPAVAVDDLGNFGARKVIIAQDDAFALYQADRYAATAAAQAVRGDYETVLLSATALGRDLGPRIAAKLGCPLAADVTEIGHDGTITVERPAYSGKAIYTLRVTAPRCVISVRPNVFSPIESGQSAEIETLPVVEVGKAVTAATLKVTQPEQAKLDVAEAAMVVSGGRGLKTPENFQLVEDLAEALGAAVGASRAVVDAGWRPHAEQVGQTGKTVSPNLYIALGISGAIQHLAGMRTSKVIVAINKDRDAPIFKVADFGVVGDVLEIVPKLTQEIKKLKEN